MTNTESFEVVLLRPTTTSDRVHDRLADMYDGVHRVVAYEVFDSPSAKVDPDGRYGGDRGGKIGEWVLGKVDDVSVFLEARGYTEYELMDEIGFDIEGPEPGESRNEIIFPGGGAYEIYRYPEPDLEDGELASFRVSAIGWADSNSFLGTVRAIADDTWSAYGKGWYLLARNMTRSEALAALVRSAGSRAEAEPKRAPVTGLEHQIVELTVRLRVDVGAWELAYGDQGGPAGIAEDVRVYVENLLGECAQRPVNYGGEGGFADFEVDHR